MRGVLGTKGHLSSNGGLRGHSVGDAFPFVVFAQGSPDALKWRIKCPNGEIVGDCDSSEEASNLACYLRDAV